ncbi:MAG: hypothetical protein GY915_07985, partial [bacterium]|nr:hypothetical protein [bacterium]
MPNAPSTYDELFESIRKKTAGLGGRLARYGSNDDVDKALNDIVEEIEEIYKTPEYKGKKDPVWGLLNREFLPVKTTSKEASVLDSKGKKTKKKVDIFKQEPINPGRKNPVYAAAVGAKGENKVLPDKDKARINAGLLAAKIQDKKIEDWNPTKEDRRLGGERGRGKIVDLPGQSAGSIVDEAVALDGILGFDPEEEGGDALDQFKDTNKSSNQSSTRSLLVPESDSVRKELISQKKIADKALETGMWYGFTNTKDGKKLRGANGGQKRPLKPEEIPMLEKMSSKLGEALEEGAEKVSFERAETNKTRGLIPDDKLINPDRFMGQYGKEGAKKANIRNIQKTLTGQFGPTSMEVAERELKAQKKRQRERRERLRGGPVTGYGGGPAKNITSAPATLIPNLEARAMPAEGVMPTIQRQPPAQPRGRFEPPPIRLSGPETAPYVPPQPRVSKIVRPDTGTTYDPKTVPILGDQDNNATTTRATQTLVPETKVTPFRHEINYPELTRQGGDPEPLPRRPDPIAARKSIKPDGAGPLIPPADVIDTDTGRVVPPGRIDRAKKGLEFAGNNQTAGNQRFDGNEDMREMETNRAREARVSAFNPRNPNTDGPLKGPF